VTFVVHGDRCVVKEAVMAFYQDDKQFYAVMNQLFGRLMKNPVATDQFARSNLVIRLNTRQPNAQILLDGRGRPVEALFGPQVGKADLELNLEADTLHRIWLGEVRLRDAFFGGQIATKGYVFKAMQLGDLFVEAERQYPQVLMEMGLR